MAWDFATSMPSDLYKFSDGKKLQTHKSESPARVQPQSVCKLVNGMVSSTVPIIVRNIHVHIQIPQTSYAGLI